MITVLAMKFVAPSNELKKHLLNHPDYVQKNSLQKITPKNLLQDPTHDFVPKFLPLSDSIMIYSPHPYIRLYVNEMQLGNANEKAISSKNQTLRSQQLLTKFSKLIREFDSAIVSIEMF